MITNEEKQD